MFGIDDLAAASLISGGIGAIGSVISGNKQANLQKEINAQNIAMQRETNQMQREMFTENLLYGTKERREQNAENWRQAVEMFNMENAYNTPAMQVARYLQAGLNPMAAAKDAGLGSGQGASSSMMSQSGIPGLTAPHALPYDVGSQNMIANIQGIANAFGSVATAKKDMAQAGYTSKITDATLDNILASTANLQEEERGKKIANDIAQALGLKHATADLYNKIGQFGLISANIEKTASEKNLNDANASFIKLKEIGQDIRNQLDKKDLDNWDTLFNLEVNKRKQDINTARASEFELWQSGREHQSMVKLNNLRSKGQDIFNQISSKENAFQEETFNSRVMKFLDEASNTDLLNQTAREELKTIKKKLEMLATEKKWQEFSILYGFFLQTWDRITSQQNANNGSLTSGVNAVGKLLP